MTKTLKDTINNENGFVLVVALLMLAVVTVIGIAATQTSDIEMRVAANEKARVDDFYDAEGGLIDRSERPMTWLTDTFLTAGEGAALDIATVDVDSDGNPDTTVEIRCIKSSAAPVAGLSAAANNMPLSEHINPPPAGSGYSVKYFEVRRYGLTSTSINGNTQLQAGMWKLFNKY